MAWNMRAQLLEACSCKMVCRCTLGPAEPDQGWCSAAFGIRLLEGQSDGVDLSGAKVIVMVELPGDFFGGIDKAKLLFDPAVGDEPRRELEAILQGQRGGVWGGLREAVASWLPSGEAAIDITDGDNPAVVIEGTGEIRLEPVKTEDGHQATLNYAPVAYGAFGQAEMPLAAANGSKFADPDMRAWESLGHGAASVVEWSG